MTATPGSSLHRITALLRAWGQGDDAALAELTPLVYAELRRMARRYVRRERRDLSLPASGLVNECYLRLVDAQQVDWQGRAHFLALAGRMMRRILVDAARARQVPQTWRRRRARAAGRSARAAGARPRSRGAGRRAARAGRVG